MPTSSGWLLLLACALAPRLGTRAVLALALLAALAHAGLSLAGGGSGTAALLLVACFWVAIGSMLAARRRAVAALAQLSRLCDVDETTECLNRRGFDAALERAAAAARRERAPLALLALDLDHFKGVNDRYGHLRGDAVLRDVGGLLTQLVGERGVVARLGGEEFAVLLPGADPEHAGEMAERIVSAFRGSALASLPDDAPLTVSAGIATERMDDEHSTDALRARADEALYTAKRNGRNRALLWAPGVQSHATPIRSLAGITPRAFPSSRRPTP